MAGSSPDPRYYKDGGGLRPRWRLFFRSPKYYLWLVQPHWLLMWQIRRRDKSRPRRIAP